MTKNFLQLPIVQLKIINVKTVQSCKLGTVFYLIAAAGRMTAGDV